MSTSVATERRSVIACTKVMASEQTVQKGPSHQSSSCSHRRTEAPQKAHQGNGGKGSHTKEWWLSRGIKPEKGINSPSWNTQGRNDILSMVDGCDKKRTEH